MVGEMFARGAATGAWVLGFLAVMAVGMMFVSLIACLVDAVKELDGKARKGRRE